MEDIYQLISDCIFNLSNLFTFDTLLQISTSSRQYSNLIYELAIHDHDNQPIYYTSTNQIKKFHNIDTLTISKYYSYKNLTELTHIKNINFHDEQQIQYVTKLTQLISCNFVRRNSMPIPYFHTNLSRLNVFCDNKINNLNNVILFSHLTRIEIQSTCDGIDAEQFLGFRKLKSLTVPFLCHLQKLSSLTSLHTISIHNDYEQHYDMFAISHPTITNIQIRDYADFEIKNCYKLMYLKLTNWGSCFLGTNILQLQTLILNCKDDDNYDTYIDFDINRCINLEYLEYSIQNLIHLSSSLTKLNSLYLGYGVNISEDDVVANNLTYLNVNHYMNMFDLNKYRNLKKLVIGMCNASHINIDKLVELEHLDREDYIPSEYNYINGINHQKLTYLRLISHGIINLSKSNKLNRLQLYNVDPVDVANMWNNDLKHLSKLTFLYMHMKKSYETSWNATKRFDITRLANHLNLKCLGCNFLVNDLSLSNKVNYLNIAHYESYSNIISKLTKLTELYISSYENIDKIDVRSLKRLNNFFQRESNLILPEITMIE